MRLLLAAAAAVGVTAAAAQMTGPPAPLPPELLREEVDPARVDYLKAHVVAEGPIAGPVRFAWPAAFYRSRLFLVGESHGTAAPHVFDLALLAHLAERVGLRDYLAEIDPVQADAFNRYLATGDDAGLRAVFDGWTATGAQWGSRAYEAKVRGVRDLNARLGAARAIRFHGLDRVQDWPAAARWLGERGLPVDAAALTAATTLRAKAALLLAALPADARGDDAPVAALRVSLAATAAGRTREQTIFAAYEALARGALAGRPAYGMWGMFHTLQAPMQRETPFAALVAASRLPAAGHIATIVLAPLDSWTLVPVPGARGFTPMRLDMLNVTGPLAKMAGSADLAIAAPRDRITVYDLDRPGSPYRAAGDFVTVRASVGGELAPADPALPATRYLRYVGVVRGSDWAGAR